MTFAYINLQNIFFAHFFLFWREREREKERGRERERDDQPVDVFGISDVWELDVLPASLVSLGDINARFKSNFLSKHVIYSSLAHSLPFLTSVLISREKIILHISMY